MKSSGEPLQALKQTPAWRWVLYLAVFGGVVALLGFKFDSKLLWILPVAIAFIGVYLVGTLHLFIHSERFRFRFLWLVRLVTVIIWIVVVWKVVLVVKIIIKKETRGSSNNRVELIDAYAPKAHS